MMKQILKMMMCALMAVMLTGCEGSVPAAADDLQPEETAAETEENKEMKLRINDTEVSVAWEENEAVEALLESVREEPLSIRMTMYGGFEQVGPLGFSLPSNDVETATDAGDIVLYTGNMIVIFYGTNSWAYTRLGHVTDRSREEMTDLLSNGDVTLTLSYE